MKKKRQKRSQHCKIVVAPGVAEMAEHTRLAYFHLLWAANHLKAVYYAVKPPEAEPIEDPRQLKMFKDE